MTPSMKLKRPVVVRRYAEEIDRFYQEDVSLRR
jgi:long-subunit acyl-CoA synthetase (AMP-forming)